MPRRKKLNPSSRIYECQVCKKKFDRNDNRLRHEQAVHHKGPGLMCQECNKSFSRQEHLDRHNCLGTRDTRKTFSCEVCEKVFSRNDVLNRHKAQVHALTRYECNQCTASYTTKYKLTKHKESKHHVNPSTSSHSTQNKRTCTQKNQEKSCHSR